MPVRKYWTLAQLRKKINQDLDLEEEVFVRPEELIEYINDAIDEAEGEIHSLNEDYFLAEAQITLVPGQQLYDPPSNIYADKIRGVYFSQQGRNYEIKALKNRAKLAELELDKSISSGSTYSYTLLNNTPGQVKMKLLPIPREAGPLVTVYFHRQANRLEVDTDICDIPEFYSFVIQAVKCAVYEKEGHPNIQIALPKLEAARNRMNAILQNRTPDNHSDEIEADLDYYDDMN